MHEFFNYGFLFACILYLIWNTTRPHRINWFYYWLHYGEIMNTLIKIRTHGSLVSVVLFVIFIMTWAISGKHPSYVLPSWLYFPMIGWFIFHTIVCFICGNGNPFVPETKEKEKN